MEKVFNSQLLLIFALYVEDNLSFMEHHESGAVGYGVSHVVCDHHGSKIVVMNDLIGYLKDFCCRLWVQSSGMLVQEQKLWLFYACHDKCQSLTLTA